MTDENINLENGAQGDISQEDRLWVALIYVFAPVLPLLVLLLEEKKDIPFIKAHNAQALVLGTAAILINGALSFVFIGMCTGPLTYILMLYYAVKAYKGEYIDIPMISDFVKDQGWA